LSNTGKTAGLPDPLFDLSSTGDKTMKQLSGILMLFILLMLPGLARADLLTIGTATYQGTTSNLIYDEDSSLIWLDYSNASATYEAQMEWAASITNTLVIDIDDDYEVTWLDASWSLPSITELANLFYDVLGNVALEYEYYWDEELNTWVVETNDYGLQNTDSFLSLISDYYWTRSLTEDDESIAYVLDFFTGKKKITNTSSKLNAVAVISAQVSSASEVPLPAAFWLMGSGLLAFIIKRKIV